jgi:hypothetical protein
MATRIAFGMLGPDLCQRKESQRTGRPKPFVFVMFHVGLGNLRSVVASGPGRRTAEYSDLTLFTGGEYPVFETHANPSSWLWQINSLTSGE